jgi:hypothetical protein
LGKLNRDVVGLRFSWSASSVGYVSLEKFDQSIDDFGAIGVEVVLFADVAAQIV